METVETALEVPKVLDDNLEVVDDIESNNKEGVEVQGSVEDLVKIDKASAAPDKSSSRSRTQKKNILMQKIFFMNKSFYSKALTFSVRRSLNLSPY